MDLSHLFNRIIEVEKERSPLLNYEPSLVALASQEGKKIARSIRFVPGCYLDRRHSMNKYNRFTERGVGFILPWVSDPWSQTLLSDLTSSRYRHVSIIIVRAILIHKFLSAL